MNWEENHYIIQLKTWAGTCSQLYFSREMQAYFQYRVSYIYILFIFIIRPNCYVCTRRKQLEWAVHIHHSVDMNIIMLSWELKRLQSLPFLKIEQWHSELTGPELQYWRFLFNTNLRGSFVLIAGKVWVTTEQNECVGQWNLLALNNSLIEMNNLTQMA